MGTARCKSGIANFARLRLQSLYGRKNLNINLGGLGRYFVDQQYQLVVM